MFANGLKAKSESAERVAIVGARGYSGAELARLALQHPSMKLAGLYATQSFSSQELLPELSSASVKLLPGGSMKDLEETLAGSGGSAPLQTVFLATPAEASMELAPKLLKRGIRVVDVSGAFRLKGGSETASQALYSKWYGFSHTSPGLVQEADYGLVPFASGIPASGLVSNPGCYATATALAMIPLFKNGLIRQDSVSVDAKSGTTGAGRKAEERLLHAEVDGGCLPYRIGRHQHEPEIAEAVARFGLGDIERASDVSFSFVPHLLPVRRGIIVSVYARLKPGVSESQVGASFRAAYGSYALARLLPLSEQTRDQTNASGTQADLGLRRVVGSARTVIAWHVRGDQLVVFSLIDNLLKGAASQAVENFNRSLGLPVETGLIEMEGVL